MADKFDTSKDDAQNYLFCRLKLVNEVNEHSNKKNNQSKIKIPKVVETTNKKTLL